MTWRVALDKFDELFASFARPYQIYISASAAAIGLLMCIYFKAGDVAITAGFATVGGLGGYTGYLRTADKKTAANAATTTAQVVTASGSATMTQGIQPDAVPPAPPVHAPPAPIATQPKEKMG
jgi:hypothetical protein